MKRIKDILSIKQIVSGFKSALSGIGTKKYWISRKITDKDGTLLNWINPEFDQTKEGDVCWLRLPVKVNEFGDLYEDEYKESMDLVNEVQRELEPLGLHLYSRDLKENAIPRVSSSGTSFSMIVLPNQVKA